MKYLGVSELICRCHRSKCYTLLFRDSNHGNYSCNRSYGVSYKNPYTILKVNPGATKKEIKAAYYDRSKELHPDKHRGDPAKNAEYLEVQEAYSTLMQEGVDNSNNAYTKARPGGPRKSKYEITCGVFTTSDWILPEPGFLRLCDWKSDPYYYTRIYENMERYMDKTSERSKYAKKRGIIQLILNETKHKKRKEAMEAQYRHYIAEQRRLTDVQDQGTKDEENSRSITLSSTD